MMDEEFDRRMHSCFGCGYFFAVESPSMLRPYQSAELTKRGINHVLCEPCAREFGNSPVIARVILTCVSLAKMETEMPESRESMIRSLFEYHPPTSETIPKFKEVTEACIAAAIVIDRVCPEGDDRTKAIGFLQQARMSANCSIANEGASYR